MSILIIPSAKYVSERLQNVGLMPPVVYPLQDGIVFDELMKQYPKIEHVLVVLGEGADIALERLNQLHNPKLDVLVLDKIGSLRDTLLSALLYIKSSNLYLGENDKIIVNFGDTIVDNSDLEADQFIYSTSMYSERWTFFDYDDQSLVIIDRPRSKYQQGSVFVGVFIFSDYNLLLSCLQENSSFYGAISSYNDKRKMTPVFSDQWYDVGHLNRYYDSKRKIQERIFNHISIDKKRGILTKYSEDKSKFVNEISWYIKLPSDIEYCRPRIFSYSLSFDKPFVKMEYYSYHTVHDLFLYGNLSVEQWVDVLSQIHFVYSDLSRYTVKDTNIISSLKEIYLDKTTRRLSDLSNQDSFSNFADHEIIVNGIKYPSLSKLSDVLSFEIPKHLFNVDHFQIIHGDLCFPNILIDDNYAILKLIDPRGSFGHFDIYGDGRYDLAKLFHSIEGGYDFIIKNMFTLDYDIDKCIINYKLNRSQSNSELLDILREVFSDVLIGNENEVRFIESLLFLSMVSLHSENVKHQMVMLATGLELLSKVIEIKEE